MSSLARSRSLRPVVGTAVAVLLQLLRGEARTASTDRGVEPAASR
jgi:hypothetical protein